MLAAGLASQDMASQQYSSELEMANSASLSVYDGDSAYAPKIDLVKESELYMVSTNDESYIDEKTIFSIPFWAHAPVVSYWSKACTVLRYMVCQQSTCMPKQ